MHVSELHLSVPFCGNIHKIRAKNSSESIRNFSSSCTNVLEVCYLKVNVGQADNFLVSSVIHDV